MCIISKNFNYAKTTVHNLNRTWDVVDTAKSLYVKCKNFILNRRRAPFQWTLPDFIDILYLLVDLLPSLWENEKIHFGRIMRSVHTLSKFFHVEVSILVDLVKTMIRQEGIQAQGLEITTSWLTFIGTLILGILPSKFLVRRISETLRLFEIADRLGERKDLTKWLVEKLPEVFSKWISFDVNNVAKDFEEKMQDIKEFVFKNRKEKKIFYNTEEVRKFTNYNQWLNDEIFSLSVENEGGTILTLLKEYKRDLDGIKGQFLDEDFKVRPMEPFCIYLTGDAGVGKSTISQFLAGALNKATVSVPISELSYIKNPGESFATGYRGQFAWIYDDFAQDLSSHEEALELIKYISPQKAAVNMASLSDPAIGIKGTLNTSLLFICCANGSHPVFNGLRSMDAFYRRRHMVVEAFCEKGSDPLVSGRYRLLNPMKNETISKEMNFKQLVALSIGKFKSHMDKQRTLSSKLQEYLENFSLETLENQGAEEELDQIRNEPLFKSKVNEVAKSILEDDIKKLQNLSGKEFQQEFDKIYYQISSEDQRKKREKIAILKQSIENIVEQQEIYEDVEIIKKIPSLKEVVEKVKNILDKIVEKSKDRIKYIYNFLITKKEVLLPLVAISAVLGSFLLKYYIGNNKAKAIECEDKKPVENLEGKLKDLDVRCESLSYVKKQKRKARKLIKGVKSDYTSNFYRDYEDYYDPAGEQEIGHEGCPDTIADNVSKLVAKQLLEIVVTSEDKVLRMQALPIKGTIIMAPRHLFVRQGKIIEKGILEFKSNYNFPRVNFEKKNLVELYQGEKLADIVLYQLGIRSTIFKDISSNFVDEDHLERLFRIEGSLVSNNRGYSKHNHTMDARVFSTEKTYNANGCIQELGETVAYNLPTEKGDCGSIFIAYNNFLRGKILGMHVAGDVEKSVGFAQIVTNEMLKTALFKFKEEEPKSLGVEPLKDMILQAEGIEWNMNVPLLGVYHKTHRVPDKTKIVPSLAFELCGHRKKEPAILSPYDIRNTGKESPLMNAIKKTEELNLPLDPDILLKIKSSLPVLFKSWFSGKLKKLTETEAINGIIGKEYVEPLNMQSSPGWPYNVDYGHSKKDLFEGEPGNYKVKKDSLLRKRLDERLEKAKNMDRYPSIWIETLKDETRSLEKIKEVNTRSFSVAPVDFIILTRQYTLDLCAHIMENRIKNGIAIGINPYSSEWSSLASHLLEKGNRGFDGDYKGYDRKLHQEFVSLFFEAVIRAYKYKEEDEKVMRILCHEMVHCVKLGRNKLYLTLQGNPSGNSLTAVLNSFVNICYIMYVYYKSVPPEYSTVMHFVENVRYIVLGDDNVVFPSAGVAKWMNFQNMKNVLKTIGIDYTPGDKKTDSDIVWKNLSQVTFLKNSFIKDGVLYKAALSLESIEEMTNWITTSMDRHTATTININTALRYLYFHGREIFEKYLDLWKEWADCNYEHLDYLYVQGGEIVKDWMSYDWNIEAQGNTVSTVYNMQGWKKVIGNALPSEVNGDKLDLKMKASTMDRPTYPLSCPPSSMKDFQNLSNQNNLDFSQVLALNSNTLHEATICNTAEEEDEMSVKWLVSRWGYIRGFTEETSKWVADYVIFNDYGLDPCYALSRISNTVINVNVSPLAQISSIASFWRGSLHYKFIWLLDGFTTGKVCVDFKYGINSSDTTDTVRFSQYSVVMDITPNKYMFEVRVPYMHHNPWCVVRNCNTATQALDSIMLGTMVMTILNPFCGPTGRCKVRLVILEKGGEDFELSGVYMNNITLRCEGEEVVGKVGSFNMELGKTAPSMGTVITAVGSDAPYGDLQYGKLQLSMSDKNVDMAHYFDRWQVLQDSKAITTAGRIETISIWDIAVKIKAWQNYFKQYMLFRATKAVIRVECNGNPYIGGALIVAHAPVSTFESVGKDHCIFNLQHAILNLNTSSSVQLECPLIIEGDFISQMALDPSILPFGRVVINSSCMPMLQISTANVANYVVYIKFVDPVLKIPCVIAIVRDKDLEDLDIENLNVEAQGDQLNKTEVVTIGEDFPLPKDCTVLDPFLSLRQLTKRYVPINLFTEDKTAIDDLYLDSFASKVIQFNTTESTKIDVGYMRLIHKIFTMGRGSMRFKMKFSTVPSEIADVITVGNCPAPKFISAIKPVLPVTVSVAVSPSLFESVGIRKADVLTNAFYNYQSNIDNGIVQYITPAIDSCFVDGYLEFQVPFASNCNWIAFTSNRYVAAQQDIYIIIHNLNNSPVKVGCRAFAAMGDDFRAKAFQGVRTVRPIDALMVPDSYVVKN